MLEKMSGIMQTNKPMLYHPCRQNDLQTIALYNRRSLNRDVRKKELLKITIENQAILKRLQDKTSNYSVHKWEEEFRHKEKIMRNMCEYPFILDGDPNKANISDGNITAYNSESRLHQF